MAGGSGGDPGDLIRSVEQAKKKSAVQQLLRSEDTRCMMDMLSRQGEVEAAARAAAAGDPAELMGMMQRLMNTKEGAQLVERITRQAKRSGL